MNDTLHGLNVDIHDLQHIRHTDHCTLVDFAAYQKSCSTNFGKLLLRFCNYLVLSGECGLLSPTHFEIQSLIDYSTVKYLDSKPHYMPWKHQHGKQSYSNFFPLGSSTQWVSGWTTPTSFRPESWIRRESSGPPTSFVVPGNPSPCSMGQVLPTELCENSRSSPGPGALAKPLLEKIICTLKVGAETTCTALF